jgi:hypothetical protein
VHIEAEGAVVDLGCPDLYQLAEFEVDVLGRRTAERHHRVVQLRRRLVDLDSFRGFQGRCHVTNASSQNPI